MSSDGHIESGDRIRARTFILPVLVAIASILLVLFFRLAPNWDRDFKTSLIVMPGLSILLAIFYGSVLISLADFREMQGTISGWLDVVGLMVIEGILAILVFADALYIAIVIVLCCVFVAYLSFAQSNRSA